jgi:multidrug efflux pump subunit AcrB
MLRAPERMGIVVTLCLAVSFSYLEAVTLAPARSAQILNVSREHRGWVGRKVDSGFHWLEGKYAKVLGYGLNRPWRVLLVGALVLGISAAMFSMLPREFVPSQDQSRLMLRFQTAVGSSLEETDLLMAKAEAILAESDEREADLEWEADPKR